MKVVYVADDGSKFEREEDCRNYEMTRYEDSKENFYDIPKGIADISTDIPHIPDNAKLYWFDLKSKEDLFPINDFLYWACEIEEADEQTSYSDIGKRIFYLIDDSIGWAYRLGSLDEVTEKVCNYFIRKANL